MFPSIHPHIDTNSVGLPHGSQPLPVPPPPLPPSLPPTFPWSSMPTHWKAEFFIKGKTMNCHDVCIGLKYNGLGDMADRMFAEELAGAKHSRRVSPCYGGQWWGAVKLEMSASWSGLTANSGRDMWALLQSKHAEAPRQSNCDIWSDRFKRNKTFLKLWLFGIPAMCVATVFFAACRVFRSTATPPGESFIFCDFHFDAHFWLTGRKCHNKLLLIKTLQTMAHLFLIDNNSKLTRVTIITWFVLILICLIEIAAVSGNDFFHFKSWRQFDKAIYLKAPGTLIVLHLCLKFILFGGKWISE